uniref:PH domain-containing protein n=1 Tax=Poecilia latipinna TaxID=48699 RepID=A0A3B3VUQ7_9TELE
MSGAADVVCEGWLRKSPPEKKLRRYAWKRRWFVLRSGRLSGEPDVLQYYKNQHSRRPIGTINLNLCEQVDAGLSFTKKELESSFVFDLRTEERTWYLVAESEDDMNRWVTSICLLCGFNPTDDGTTKKMSQIQHVPLAVLCTPTITMVTGSIPPPYDPVSVRHLEHDSSLQDGNYVPMTPLTSSLPALPPPAHMGFRNSTMTPVIPSTPPLRRNTMHNTSVGEAEVVPPPIHRNLKPQRKVKPAPLEITPVSQDWQEVPPPVRSPVTRTFTRGPSIRGSFRPSSAQSSSPSSDSDDPDDSYVTMVTCSFSQSAGEQVKHIFIIFNHQMLIFMSGILLKSDCFRLQSLRMMLHRGSEGGVSNTLVRRAEKQVEYLDLDLHTGRSTPTRQVYSKKKNNLMRVDYVVVDPKRTKALKNTREAWHDGRMSTEKEKS